MASRAHAAFRWWRMPLWALVAVLSCEGALNLALNVGAVQALVHRAAPRTRLSWQRAWWVWPGRLQFRGFALEQQDAHARWRLDVERLEAGLSLSALTRRRVEARRVEGTGVRVRVEPEKAPPAPARTSSGKPPWEIRLTEVVLRDVRDLDLGPARYTGTAEAEGSLDVKLHQKLHVELTSLRLDGGFVEVRGHRVARVESASGRMSLETGWRPTGGWDITTAVSGRLQAGAEVLALDWVNARPGAHASVSVHGGKGRLELDVRMRKGELEPGSRVEARGETLEVRAGPSRARAPWTLQASVESEAHGHREGRLRLAFAPVHVEGPEGHGVEVPEVAVTLHARRREGAPGLDLERELHVAKSHPMDLRALNPWLSRTLQVDSGHVTLRGEGRPRTQHGGNWLHVSLDTDLVEGRMGDNRLLLRAGVEVDARRLSLGAKGLGLDGTTLRLSDVSSNGPVPIRGWSGSIALPQATLALSPVVLEARFTSELTDTQPLASLLATRKGLPPFLAPLLDIKKLSVTGHVRMDRNGLQVRELKAQGQDFQLEGHLDLVQGKSTGAVLATVGPTTGAVELKPDGHHIHLKGARDWYNAQPR
ncbi:MAG: hypothetical protein EOO71_06125 [Myxococcaceae bacterium]|nr:MAG: hypothetical protein EOO71_06125 [Myxococcaceae bacterium]